MTIQPGAWIKALRLHSLPLAIGSIGMGSFIAAADRQFSWFVFLFSTLTTILLQLLSNLANDYGDAIHGADSDSREGPSRAVQSGNISTGAMKRAIVLFAVLALASGAILVFRSVHDTRSLYVLLGIGIMSVIAAITYTMGKRPYGYSGLGDISVFLFFGWVGVLGTYFLHTTTIDPWILLPASACSLLSVAVLNVNNIRDIESDKLAGKKSIPVRIGAKRAKQYHRVLIFGAIMCAIIYTAIDYRTPWQWLFLLMTPFFFRHTRAIFRADVADAYNPRLKQLVLAMLMFVVLFGIGQLLPV
jgi:1,4-dihydroxy-2-naphthoate octaprenyltransferase